MASPFSVQINAWPDGAAIPSKYAFGRPGTDSPFAPSDNISPAIHWHNIPEGTRSFAIICYDPDVPSSGEDVNQKGKIVPSDLPRTDFYHWTLVDIPADITKIEEGAASQGITQGGKPVGSAKYGMTGVNDYTSWFAGDPEMEGVYGSYDGPCPPWNDSIVHRYFFTVFALDVESLGLEGEFSGQDVKRAMAGHILAQDNHMGRYSMNPSFKA